MQALLSDRQQKDSCTSQGRFFITFDNIKWPLLYGLLTWHYEEKSTMYKNDSSSSLRPAAELLSMLIEPCAGMAHQHHRDRAVVVVPHQCKLCWYRGPETVSVRSLQWRKIHQHSRKLSLHPSIMLCWWKPWDKKERSCWAPWSKNTTVPNFYLPCLTAMAQLGILIKSAVNHSSLTVFKSHSNITVLDWLLFLCF